MEWAGTLYPLHLSRDVLVAFAGVRNAIGDVKAMNSPRPGLLGPGFDLWAKHPMGFQRVAAIHSHPAPQECKINPDFQSACCGQH